MAGKSQPTPPEEDDDFEYEVEPADEAVTAHQAQRAREDLKRAQQAVDVDAIYRELDRRDDFDAAFEEFRARFSVKSLLVATTVLAVLLAVARSSLVSGAGFAVLICLSLVGLGAAHAWLNFREARRREELIAKRQAELRAARGDAAGDDDLPDSSIAGRSKARSRPAAVSWGSTFTQFTPTEGVLAVLASAVMLSLLYFAGTPAQGAGALGALALTGFALLAAEISIPRPLVLAWWITLMGFGMLWAVAWDAPAP